MAWNTPVTVTAGSPWTAAMWNTYVRDNQLEFAAAKLSSFSGTDTLATLFSTSSNSVTPREIRSADDAGGVSVTQTTYQALGPQITMDTSSRVMVLYTSRISLTSVDTGLVSVSVGGATSVPASDDWALSHQGTGSDGLIRTSRAHVFDNLNTGTNVFALRYRVSGGTQGFAARQIVVIDLGD